MRDREVYITGASGFLGSHLIEKLDVFTPIPHQEITTYDYKPYERFYFLSAYGNMPDHDDDPQVIQANVGDLLHVLSKSDFKHLESFVYISTSSVRLKIQTLYSRTKKAAEEILLAFAEKYNAPICIIRPYSITGVGDQYKHLIPTLIRSCLLREKVDLVLDPVHDYIDADDVAEGILNLSMNRAKGVFELGNGVGYSNKQVLAEVEEVCGCKANVNIVGNMRPYDTDDWVCKNFHARQYGWMPKKSLQQSIIEMVKEYEQP
jgi:nucleoside-diphosphate-sugar epimerase